MGYGARSVSFGRSRAQVQVKWSQRPARNRSYSLISCSANSSTGVQLYFLTALILFRSGSRKVRIAVVLRYSLLMRLKCNAVDTDILKPDTGSVPFERKSPLSSRFHSTEGSSGLQTPDRRNSGQQYTEPVSEGEEDEEMDLAPARDERQRTGITGQALDEAIAYRERMLKENQTASASRSSEGQSGEGPSERTPFLKSTSSMSQIRPRAFSIDPLAPSQAFDKTLRERLGNELDPGATSTTNRDGRNPDDVEVDEALRSDERIVSRDFRAPKGKRIAVPVRIEPKVYFASERTFLVRFPSYC